MKKKYLELKDYFVDRKQSKTFKKWNGCGYLFNENVVILSNNNSCSDFFINIDNFKNSTIIFKNSTFSNIEITEYNRRNNNHVIFENCTIKFGRVVLCGESGIDLINCKLHELSIIKAHNIRFTDIKNDDELELVKINAGCKDTKNIKIERVKGRISLDVSGDDIDICDSSFYLNIENSNNINIKNSDLLVKSIDSKDRIMLLSSKLRHPLTGSTSGLIDTKLISINAISEISNCYIKTDDMNVLNNSYLLIQNSYFDISNILEIRIHSYVEDNQYKKSVLDVTNICIHPNSGIDVRGFEYSNVSEDYIEIGFNKLKDERKKLVKALYLINDKYNPQIKELE